MRIRGKCHCGNIGFSLAWEPDPAQIPARACTCSFCVKHGGVWTSHPNAVLRVSIEEPAKVSKYGFGTRSAEFHVCARCGVVPLVTSRIDGRVYAVGTVDAFDGEATDDRLARRKRNWIADVAFDEAPLRAL